MSHVSDQQRKNALLSQIQQERIDLAMATRDWVAVTAPYDRGWNKIVALRRYVVIASSIFAMWSVRKPNKITKIVRRGFGLWSTWRVIRNTISPHKTLH